MGSLGGVVATYILIDEDKNIISVGKHPYYLIEIFEWPKESNGEKVHKSKLKYENNKIKEKVKECASKQEA
jgi:hypothetical protein